MVEHLLFVLLDPALPEAIMGLVIEVLEIIVSDEEDFELVANNVSLLSSLPVDFVCLEQQGTVRGALCHMLCAVEWHVVPRACSPTWLSQFIVEEESILLGLDLLHTFVRQ